MGSLPPSISNMSNLETLWLSFNSIEGTIPTEFRSQWEVRRFPNSSEQFSGTISEEIWNLNMLRLVSFHGNFLTMDDIDTPLFNMYLEILGLHQNDLNGVIPGSISNASNLIWLSLQFNSFTGVIPNSLRNLRNIKNLDLASNNLATDSSARSSFLISLTSYSNKLTSKIHTRLWNVKNLQELNLSSNLLSGSLPPKIDNLKPTYLLDFSVNQL
ncbi:unnamed protein product [Coffea canephora]|uniref:DH200=94 genomic scaffold, scaffold_641 n=1 Tax=Coffea canephora TaxID=49390 RepID=A0A068VGA6_COFCA|nr:unnamed protein product [Coffea canephora]